VADIFGFEQELDDLRQRIVELSWDTTFGMWTRPAFLEFCRVMPRGRRVVALIDLNHIHDLNYQCGYTEVDRRIKMTFAIPFRRSDIVARWYSGDEIVILFDGGRVGMERKIEELRESACNAGLTFMFAIGEWEVGCQLIEEVVTALSQRIAQEKLLNPPTRLLEPA
jgi:GGDEF domain-containing protein